MAYAPGKEPWRNKSTGTSTSKSAPATRTGRGTTAKKSSPPAIPKPYKALPKAPSTKPTIKGKLRVPKAPKKPSYTKTKAYKATKGTASKKAVKRTTSKVMNRQLKSKGSTNVTAAKQQARRIVRARKMRKGK